MQKTPKKQSQTVVEVGRLGGQKNAANHNHEYFVQLGRKAARKRWSKKQKKEA